MPERHPIRHGGRAGQTLEERVRFLENALARLWDQVWWMNLSEEQREAYRKDGYNDPIPHFYEVTDL